MSRFWKRFLVIVSVLWAAAANWPDDAAGQENGQVGGIHINADGVVSSVLSAERSGPLLRRRLEAAAAQALPADVNRPSELRMVSLPRLEAACDELAQRGEELPDVMKHLAGLQRIEYVFVYPETDDVVLAGPAEGFAPDATGRMVGVSSGRPPVRLDDLMVAMQAVERGGTVGCSIDPNRDRQAQFERWLAANSNPVPASVAQARYHEMCRILGMQEITVWGVPPESHFARVLVEADYRMKLLNMGLEQSTVRGFRSYLAMLTPQGNSLQRWWFAPLYDAFTTDGDELAWQFAGPRAQILSQEEHSDGAGGRRDAPTTRLSVQKWAQQFTDKFPELADAMPAFAELQNAIDLLVAAALLKRKGLPEKVGWTPSRFLDAEFAAWDAGPAPRQVQTICNYRLSNRRVYLGLVGGGVLVQPERTFGALEFRTDERDRLGGLRTKLSPPQEADASAWWWDADVR